MTAVTGDTTKMGRKACDLGQASTRKRTVGPRVPWCSVPRSLVSVWTVNSGPSLGWLSLLAEEPRLSGGAASPLSLNADSPSYHIPPQIHPCQKIINWRSVMPTPINLSLPSLNKSMVMAGEAHLGDAGHFGPSSEVLELCGHPRRPKGYGQA